MTSTRLDRRQLLRALGLGAAALPFVPLLEAHARSAPPPKRIVFFFTANGTVHDAWAPKMAAGKLELSPILEPLQKHASQLLVVDGLCHKVILEKSDRSGHSAGMNTALTGCNNKIVDPAHPLQSLGTGISLDQHLGAALGGATKLRSIQCGIQVELFHPAFASLSYRGPLQPLYPENNPARIFDRVFRDVAGPGAPPPEELADRRRLLESVSKDLGALGGRLPREDRVKVEAHLEAVRAIGHSLSTGVGAGSGHACRKPELGPSLDPWKNGNIPAVAKLQMDLVAMALACDLTRVATVQFGNSGASHRFSWLGPGFQTDPALPANDGARGFHALSHRDDDPPSRAKLVEINRWYAQQFGYLLDKLASIPEAGGSLLDRTVVVWLNELGSGGKHSHDHTPWVLGGSAGGFFKTGQVVSFPGEPHNRLLATLCRAMGVATDVFGDPDYCKAGPLTGVTR